MSHYYQITDPHRAFLREDINTPAQARREWLKTGEKIVASVTEKLKVAPSPFFNKYRVKEAIRITRENPHLDDATIMQLIWQTRKHPVTGEQVGSAEWGTQCHKQLELAMNGEWEPNEWEPFVQPFVSWALERDLEVLATETVIASIDPLFNTAGTIDLLARTRNDGKVALFDYKTRRVSEGGDIKRKYLPKDCQQLASESFMIRNMMELDYNPKIFTVIINTEDGDTHVKQWTYKAFEKGLAKAMYCFKFFDDMNEL